MSRSTGATITLCRGQLLLDCFPNTLKPLKAKPSMGSTHSKSRQMAWWEEQLQKHTLYPATNPARPSCLQSPCPLKGGRAADESIRRSIPGPALCTLRRLQGALPGCGLPERNGAAQSPRQPGPSLRPLPAESALSCTMYVTPSASPTVHSGPRHNSAEDRLSRWSHSVEDLLFTGL